MAQIRGGEIDFRERLRESARDLRQSEDDFKHLLKEIAKDRGKAAELAKIDVRQLTAEGQQKLGQLLAQELRGQLPTALAQALATAQVGPDMLQNLAQRFANSVTPDAHTRVGHAATPDQARAQASDQSMPQQALRWTQFVQRTTHVPAAQLHDRAGTATPKGEMATLAELIGQRARLTTGAGLKTPKLVERALSDLSPGQRAALMKATFGEKLAQQLLALGISDPLSFVKAGALPTGRAALAGELAMERGKLLTMLMQAELLKIGPGRNGEVGIRPDLLGPLHKAGIGMLGTLANLRSMSREELTFIYSLLRQNAGGFGKALKGSRPPVKRDLIHWARTAARKPSDILLADNEERQGPVSRGDAQELIQAWYLENLLWETLARRRDEEMARHRERLAHEQDEEREQRQGEGRGGGDDGSGNQNEPDDGPALEYDGQRDDRLICFWVTDFNTDPSLPEAMRRMYVCVDPDTGAILPQQVEAAIKPASGG